MRADELAVIVPHKEQISYARLGDLADQVRDRLRHVGVSRGDRVGLYLSKSAAAVASIFGVLKTGAAYVPIDPDAPPDRVQSRRGRTECAEYGAISRDGGWRGRRDRAALERELEGRDARPGRGSGPDDELARCANRVAPRRAAERAPSCSATRDR